MQVSSLRNTRGQAFVELALVLPILVLLLVGVYDFACAIRADNTISNMSREGANLASRTSMAPQDIMNTLAMTAKPLDMQNNGMIYITVVQRTAGQTQILNQTGWQNSNIKNTITSRIGTPTPGSPTPPAQNLGSLPLAANQTINVVEVFYYYTNLFSANDGRLGRQFYSRTIF